MVAGTLESLVEATPQRLGHTHLRELHLFIHPIGSNCGNDIYFIITIIPQNIRDDLKWWILFLGLENRRYLRPTEAATLVLVGGDGSGTGAGVIYQLPNNTELTM